jgi:hypothetical protein
MTISKQAAALAPTPTLRQPGASVISASSVLLGFAFAFVFLRVSVPLW